MKTFRIFLIFLISSSILFSQTDNRKLFEDAKSLYNSGRFGEAIEILNRIITSNPNSSEGLLLRGLANEKRGNYEQAVYDLRTALKISPENSEIKNQLSRIESDWHRLLFNRIEGYKREIAIDPSIAKNYLEIGKCYKNLGEWKEAEIWYDLYLEREEASSDEMIRYTEILAKNNQIKKGEPYLKNYVEKYPDDHRLWSRYGYFLFWLGKINQAESAFLMALDLRPFFKEALDGLDLVRGKKGIYSINDTTFRKSSQRVGKVYLIDKYFTRLKSDSANTELRYKLVEELIKHNRIEEAYQQLQILQQSQSDNPRFQDLFLLVLEERNQIIDKKISELEAELLVNSANKEVLAKLDELLNYRGRSEDANRLLENFLSKYDDNEIRFLLARNLFWSGELCRSKEHLEILLSKNYESQQAELMLAKILLWLEQDLERAEYLFEKVLFQDNWNTEAITGLLDCKIKLQKFSEYEHYLNIYYGYLSPQQRSNFSLKYTEALKNKKLKENFELKEKARKLAREKNIPEAIKIFEKLLRDEPDNNLLSQELADLYSANNQFNLADKIYDDILRKNYDYEIDKRKAKNILWSKDYPAAVREFRRLNLKNSDDVEVQLLLADSYLFSGNKDKAREIYYELLAYSRDSYILNQRLIWLGDKSISGFSFNLQFLPSAFLFKDNIDFQLFKQSLGIKTAVSENFAVGGTIHRGVLSSSEKDRTFITAEGVLNLRLSDLLRLETSFGQTFFDDNQKQLNAMAALQLEKENHYNLSLSYQLTDAAFVLYSPFIVQERIKTNLINFYSAFYPGLNFQVSTRYLFISPENNQGHQLSFRLGNRIFSNIIFGYEFYYYTFEKQTNLYWSPKDFNSHSLWFDWHIINSDKFSIGFGAKGGIIPENNFLLSEGSLIFRYIISKNILFTVNFSGSSTYRNTTGNYRSFSVFSTISFSL